MRNNAAFKAAALILGGSKGEGKLLYNASPCRVGHRTVAARQRSCPNEQDRDKRLPFLTARQCFHNLGAVAPSDSLGEGGRLRCKGGIMPGALQLARQPEQYVTFVISSDW